MSNDTKDYALLISSPGEIEVPKDDPFKYDELRREGYAKTLTNVVKSFQDGTVIALNGAWGTGKTTFIRMWKQHLENEHFPVAYYNAWVDDISDEPLYSLLKQLKEAANQGKDGSKLKKVLTTGARILARIAFAGAKASMGKVGDLIIKAGKGSAKEIKKIIEETGKGGLDAIQGVFEKSLEDEKDSIHSLMKDFREAFQSYVEYDKDEERAAVPFVYFVDELDRCNPTFAVKVLERIKHLFEVPNVVFVLSVDKKQLAYSINGYFGSEQFDSNEYLRRFIGIEYNLPSLTGFMYYGYLMKKYGIERVIGNLRQECRDYEKLVEYHRHLISDIIIDNAVSLRQLEKIFAVVQLMLYDYSFVRRFLRTDEESFFIPICFFLSYLKVCNTSIYQNIIRGRYTLQELSDELESIMPKASSYHFVEKKLVENTDHIALCLLLVLAHYSEFKILFLNRFEQENGITNNGATTSFQELTKIKFKRISSELLINNQSLFDTKLDGINIWIDKMELY